jgi:hypothetical protein
LRRAARGEGTRLPEGRQANARRRDAPLRRRWRPVPEPADPLWPAFEPCAPDARLPVVIGVTGHRDIAPDAVPAIDAALRRFFDLLVASVPATPVVLLSPLAEGSDRRAARAFLEAVPTAEAHLVAPLPLPAEEYREDFRGAVAVGEFDELLRLARVYPPAADPPGSASGEGQRATAGGVDRLERYERVGLFVARHCHILLALWDGEPAHGRGGTGQIVRDRLGPGGGGPVLHIRTPRPGAAGAAHAG